MERFELRLRERNIPENKLFDDLRRVANLFSQDTITKVQYDQKGLFGATTYLRRFGSWNKTLMLAGLKVVNLQNIECDALFENLANTWQHLGRQPVGKDMDKAAGVSLYSLGTYEKRFGSWNKALKAFIEFINSSSDLNGSTEKNIVGVKKETQSGRSIRKINWRLRATVLIRDNCLCKMCGASPAKDPSVVLHVDHIKPWSKGGETIIENLRTLCSVCNIGRSNVV